MNFAKLHRIVGIVLLQGVIACSGPATPRLQPVPTVSLDEMSAGVREQISLSLARLDASPLDSELNGNLGMLFDAYSRDAEAAIFYDRARTLEPARFRWQYLHGRTLARLGDSAAAITALERALELRPGHPGTQLELAGQYYAAGNIEKSTELYEFLIERNPSYVRAYFAYGKLLFEQGETSAAVEWLETTLRLSNRFGKAHNLLAQAYSKTGDAVKSDLHMRLFERFRHLEPAQNNSLLDKVASLNISDSNRLEQALILSATGQHLAAAEMLEKLATPTNASAHINLIATYAELGQFEKAQQHADIALSLEPESLELHDNIGVLRIRQGRYNEAASSFRVAIDLDPEFSVPYKNLGLVSDATGDTETAIDFFRRAVELDPYDRQARYFLAETLLDDDNAAEAIEQISVITSYSQPETPLYLQLLGRAYERTQEYEKSIEAYHQSVVSAQVRGQVDIATQATAQLKRVRGKLAK